MSIPSTGEASVGTQGGLNSLEMKPYSCDAQSILNTALQNANFVMVTWCSSPAYIVIELKSLTDLFVL